MEKEKFRKVLELYWEHGTLRETERTGCKNGMYLVDVNPFQTISQVLKF